MAKKVCQMTGKNDPGFLPMLCTYSTTDHKQAWHQEQF